MRKTERRSPTSPIRAANRSLCNVFAGCFLILACPHASFAQGGDESDVVEEAPVELTRERLRTSLYGAGFTIWLDDPIIDQLLEIQNHLTQKEYVKAFRLIDERRDTFRGRLVPWGHGLYLTAERYFWKQLVELPPTGREAFRLYYEARAQKLAEGWDDTDGDRGERIAKDVYNAYFLTSVGDNAANRLGEAAFRRGQFQKAAGYWADILKYAPDSELSELKLRVKRVVALHHAGRLKERDAERATIASRFADEQVMVGGQSQLATKYIANLPPSQLHDKIVRKEVEQTAELPKRRQWRWRTSRNNASIGAVKMVGDLLVIHEGARLTAYNSTGQSRWTRGGGGSNLLNKIQNFFGFGGDAAATIEVEEAMGEDAAPVETPQPPKAPAPPDAQGTDVAPFQEEDDGNAFQAANVAMAVDDMMAETAAPQVNDFVVDGDSLYTCLRIQEQPQLHRVDKKTGLSRWVAKLPNYQLASSPAVAHQRAFIVGFRGANDMYLLAVRVTDGALLWQTKLGAARSGNNEYGTYTRTPSQLLCDDRYVYVMTNEGATFSVEMHSGDIAWMCKTTPKPMTDNSNYWSTPVSEPTLGGIFKVGSLLIFKETGAPGLHVFDVESQRLVRSRRVLADAQLVHVDGSTLWLKRDHELEAVDWQRNEMIWAVATAKIGKDVLVGEREILVPTERGIFEVDRATGDIRKIARDSDMAYGGGRLLAHDGELFNVNYRSLRAYFKDSPPSPSPK